MKKGKNQTSRKEYTGFAKFRKEWIEPILVAFVLVFLFKAYLFQNFKIPSGSMEDTLLVGDYLFASKFAYGTKIPFTHKTVLPLEEPEVGDIIVFESPVEPSKDLIKRCVAVGGQTVEVRDKQLYVDGKLQEMPTHGKHIDSREFPPDISTRDNMRPVTVPDGMLFMMGDNRDDSHDSRFWGFMPVENIKGKALFIYWSWDTSQPLWDLGKRVRWERIFDQIK